MKKKIQCMIILLMAVTLISCHQDPQAPSLPYIAVDQGAWQDFTHEGGFREVVVKTNRSWSIECDADWLAFDPQSAEVEPGQEREFTVIITAIPNAVGNDLDTRVRFKTSAVYADMTVRQEQNPDSAPSLIYYNDFGLDYEGWDGSADHPWIQDSRCWRYERGAGIETLKYYYTKEMSARNSSMYNSIDYAGASGENHLYFGKGTGSLVLGSLKIHPEIKAVDISFGTLRSVYNDSENIVDLRGEWNLHVSTDGVKWVKLPIETSSELKNSCWAYCTAGFAFGTTTPEYLYVRLMPTVVYRFDDLRITNGKSENVIDWTEGVELSLENQLEIAE